MKQTANRSEQLRSECRWMETLKDGKDALQVIAWLTQKHEAVDESSHRICLGTHERVRLSHSAASSYFT